mmetsp:Transcript_39919/g.94708  ORF Transcript_39919/g.94708 Transcript_39919/m.94708 type:complete len:231 (+) Transcript_39919:1361-2053(+)
MGGQEAERDHRASFLRPLRPPSHVPLLNLLRRRLQRVFWHRASPLVLLCTGLSGRRRALRRDANRAPSIRGRSSLEHRREQTGVRELVQDEDLDHSRRLADVLRPRVQDRQLPLLQEVEGPFVREHPGVHLPPLDLRLPLRPHRLQVVHGLGRVGAARTRASRHATRNAFGVWIADPRRERPLPRPGNGADDSGDRRGARGPNDALPEAPPPPRRAQGRLPANGDGEQGR